MELDKTRVFQSKYFSMVHVYVYIYKYGDVYPNENNNDIKSLRVNYVASIN